MKKISKLVVMSLLVMPLFTSCNDDVSSAVSEVSNDTTSEIAGVSTSEISSEVEISSPDSISLENIKPETFSIYSINDTHGSIEEDAESSSYQPGLVNLDYAIKNDEDFTDYSILLSAGDMSQGSGLSNISKGDCMMESMNAMGFDAMTIGNHEFDWGIEGIERMQEKANFPFLGINITNKDDGEIADFSQPSTIIQKGAVKVGVIGSIYKDISSSISASAIQDILFTDDVPLVEAEAERLKVEEECDLVIVETHQGGSTAAASAFLKSSYIDGVFGGHDHQFTNISNSDNSCYFLEAGSNSKGYAKMTFSLKENQYEAAGGFWHKVTESESYGATSPLVLAVINKYLDIVGDVLDEVVAERDDRFSRSNLGTLITEAMMDYAKNTEGGEDIAVAVHNRGGIRDTWTSTTDSDGDGLFDITYSDIYSVMPFDNQVQWIMLTGTDLINACKNHYHSKNYEVVGGKKLLNGVEINPDTEYKVFAIDYIITDVGDPCYKGIGGGTNLNGDIALTRDIFNNYVKALGTVNVADFPVL